MTYIVIAMPMNQSSTTTLTILVDDVNDNAPVISSCSSDSVPETDIIGNPILTVSSVCIYKQLLAKPRCCVCKCNKMY